MRTDILNFNFDLKKDELPFNIYAIRIEDNNGYIYDLSLRHNGYCPNITTEREQSKFNDYLSNLESEVINEYFKSLNLKKPKTYSNLIEVMTNEYGEVYHLSKVLPK